LRVIRPGMPARPRLGAAFDAGCRRRIPCRQDVADAAGAGEEPRRDGDVGDVSGRERQRQGAADDIGEEVDLGRLAAPRGTDRLRPRAPFPPKAERCALM
jgi:hypothetical protein